MSSASPIFIKTFEMLVWLLEHTKTITPVRYAHALGTVLVHQVRKQPCALRLEIPKAPKVRDGSAHGASGAELSG